VSQLINLKKDVLVKNLHAEKITANASELE